jgi:mRNA interferase MazF
MAYLRGNVYYVDLGYGRKPFLVVSNNGRNAALGSALAVRITTTSKPPLPSIIPIPHGEPVTGSILCDDIETLYDDDPAEHAGALSPATMRAVNAALKVALSLQ